MITAMKAKASPTRQEFDPAGFAATLAAARGTRGWSTRELARRAGVSQPYVVALERGSERGPTPTVEVIARLANAFHLDPKVLFDESLRAARRHVLLVIEGPEQPTLEIVRQATGEPDLAWMWAATSVTARRAGRGAAMFIDIRRNESEPYHPDRIEHALADELQSVQNKLPGGDIGMVFAETSHALASLDDPSILLEFERRWDDVVDKALKLVEQRARWNVCVYDLADLLRFNDPPQAIVDLCHSHHEMWHTHGDRLETGIAGATAVLHEMRPPGTTVTQWRQHVNSVVETMRFAT